MNLNNSIFLAGGVKAVSNEAKPMPLQRLQILLKVIRKTKFFLQKCKIKVFFFAESESRF